MNHRLATPEPPDPPVSAEPAAPRVLVVGSPELRRTVPASLEDSDVTVRVADPDSAPSTDPDSAPGSESLPLDEAADDDEEAVLGTIDADCVLTDDRELRTAARFDCPVLSVVDSTDADTAALHRADPDGTTEFVTDRTIEHSSLLAHRIRRTVEFAATNRALERRDEWYRSLLERSSDLLFILDESGQITYVSPSEGDGSTADEPTGASSDDLGSLRGSHFLEQIHPDDRGRVREALEAVRAAEFGATESVEYQCRTSGRTDTWGIYEAVLTNRLADDLVDGVVASVRDVTEYHRVERELDESFRRVTDAFFALDTDWRFSYINDRAASTLDADRSALLGERILEAFPEMADTPFQTAALEAMEHQEPQTLERYYEPYESWIEARIYPSPTGISVYFRDVTDRVEREQELEARTERLQTLVDNVPVVLFALDPDGTVTLAEGHGLKRIDTVPADLVGESICDIFDDYPTVRMDLRAALEGYPIHTHSQIDGRAFEAWCRPITTDRTTESGDVGSETERGDAADGNATSAGINTDADGTSDATDSAGTSNGTDSDGNNNDTGNGNGVERVIGIAVDVTERVQYQETLNALHDATSHLLTVESKQAACEYIVDVASDVLDLDAGVYRFDDRQNELVPAAYSTELESIVGRPPRLQPGDSITWDTFVSSSASVFDDVRDSALVYDETTDARSGLYVPLGEHGVLVAVSTEPGQYDTETAELAQLFARTAEAALDRIGRTRRLHDRERELKRQNTRLEHLNDANQIRQEIEQLLLMADSRDEIERGICDQLTDLEACSMAWIGTPDPSGNQLRPRSQAGRDHGYLEAVPVTTVDDSAAEPAGQTARTRTPTYVENIADSVHDGAWRAEALSQTFQSVYAVPLVYDGFLYGVLSLYADDRNAFDERLRSVLAELGETIGYSIDAVKRRHSSFEDDVTEVELEIERGSVFSELATELDAAVELEGATTGEEGPIVFVSVDEAVADSGTDTDTDTDTGTGTGSDPDATPDTASNPDSNADGASESDTADDSSATDTSSDSDAANTTSNAFPLETVTGVSDGTCIADTDGRILLQLQLTGPFLGSVVDTHGGALRSLAVETDGTARALVDVPDAVEIRDILSGLNRRDFTASMIARREQPVETHTPLDAASRNSLLDRLTDRQREVVQTAYHGGYFEWPRQTTGEELAASLDISSPAFHKHIRAAERKLFDTLFEDTVPAMDG